MKMLLILLSLGILSSCSSVQDKRNLSQRIDAEKVRSLQEIKAHAGLLIESHPELDEKTKMEISSLIDVTINKQQELKDEESKIFQLLLSKSFRVEELTDSELKDKNSLKIRLKEVYENKSDNLLKLISQIVGYSNSKAINKGFRDDMIIMMRDFP